MAKLRFKRLDPPKTKEEVERFLQFFEIAKKYIDKDTKDEKKECQKN